MDDSGHVWLLEANPDPCLGMFNQTREEICGPNPLDEVPETFVHCLSVSPLLEAMRALRKNGKKKEGTLAALRALREAKKKKDGEAKAD